MFSNFSCCEASVDFRVAPYLQSNIVGGRIKLIHLYKSESQVRSYKQLMMFFEQKSF